MDIAHLIRHPEELNKDTLYELRELVAVAPYFQAARLLFLKNLFLLHDASFDKELRRAALYLPDRKLLFNMVHGKNYEIRPAQHTVVELTDDPTNRRPDRTTSLIDSFLNQSPQESKNGKRVKADPASDYMSYLLQTQQFEAPPTHEPDGTPDTPPPPDRTQTLIDTYIDSKPERLSLNLAAQGPDSESPSPIVDEDPSLEEECMTETLAKIYIQQGRYERAIEIITKLNLNNRKKSIYFADQIRFLQKLAINNKHKS